MYFSIQMFFSCFHCFHINGYICKNADVSFVSLIVYFILVFSQVSFLSGEKASIPQHLRPPLFFVYFFQTLHFFNNNNYLTLSRLEEEKPKLQQSQRKKKVTRTTCTIFYSDEPENHGAFSQARRQFVANRAQQFTKHCHLALANLKGNCPCLLIEIRRGWVLVTSEENWTKFHLFKSTTWCSTRHRQIKKTRKIASKRVKRRGFQCNFTVRKIQKNFKERNVLFTNEWERLTQRCYYIFQRFAEN